MKLKINRLIQKMVAIIIIIIMLLADSAVIGINAISYALNMVATNSNNVEFFASFVDDKKQELKEIDNEIGSSAKMHIEVVVKKEGYFNGAISLENPNFEFTQNYNSEYVKQINKDKIDLNQINSGTTAVIEVEVKYIWNEKIELDSLSKNSIVKLSGIYKSSEKDVDINGKTELKINWKSKEKLEVNVDAKVITNKVYTMDTSEKRIIQLEINSKLKEDPYPIKNTKVKVNVPNGVEDVNVFARQLEATNKDLKFNENNYEYNKDTNILEINVKNEEIDGKINWNKKQYDTFIVTLIYPQNIEIEGKINIESIIDVYDKDNIKKSVEAEITNEIDGIVTSDITLDEPEFYKGKLYTNEKRYYTTATVINSNYAKINKNIKVEEKDSKFILDESEKEANIQYVQSKINKSELENILGTDGTLVILNQEGKEIAKINKETTADEKGYINISYPSGIKAIKIESSKIENEGTLNIRHRKVVLKDNYSKEEIAKITNIKEQINNGEYISKNIKLKEVESKANIKISNTTLSALDTNKNIEIVATLEADNESKELYENPGVDIVFPEEIKELKILSAKALYRNGLKVKNCQKIKDKNGRFIMHIEFEGKQEKYNAEILNGLEIHIYADITLNKLTADKETKLIMNYTNEKINKKDYSVETNVNIKSEDGLILYNQLSNYNKNGNNLEVVNDENAKAKLDINSDRKTIEVKTAVVNNYEDKLTKDIVVIGKVPSKDTTNTFDAKIKKLKVNNSAKVYYNTNSNASANDNNWKEDSNNAKAYKVVLNGMEAQGITTISYSIDIPKNLSYNEKGVITTNVSYNYYNLNLNENGEIILETEKALINQVATGKTYSLASGIEVKVTEMLGNKEIKDADSIFEGETLKYIVNIKNNTGNDINNLNINTTQTNGKVFGLVEKEVYNPQIYEDNEGKGIEHYWDVTDSSTKKFENLSIDAGKEISLDWQVTIKKEDGTEAYNKIDITNADNTLNESITTEKHTIEDAEIKMKFVPAVSEECTWKSDTIQQTNLEIINNSTNELTDIEVQMVFSQGLDFNYDKYLKFSDDIQLEIKNKEINELGQTIVTVKITKLASGQTGYIYVSPKIDDFKEKNKDVEFYALAMTSDNKTYSSNSIVRNATRTKNNISITQTAKINGSEVTENTIANNNDTVEFDITIKNEESKDINSVVSDFIPKGLEVSSIYLINNENQAVDLKSNLNDNNFNYSFILKSNEEINIKITAKINTLLLEESIDITNTVELNYIYSASVSLKVNVIAPDNGKLNITAVQTSTPEDESLIKNGQEITLETVLKNTCDYDRKITILDYLNSSFENIKVFIDGNDVTSKYLTGNEFKINDYVIKPNTQITLRITANINLGGYEQDKITNEIIIKSDYPDFSSNIITYYTGKKPEQNTDENYTVSGLVWLDSNKNGKRDNNEERIKEIEIKAINTKTQKIIESNVKSSEDGTYKLKLPKGKYIIIFMYDNEEYYCTTYHADGVKENINSDAISKKIKIDDKEVECGATDEINLVSNKSDIDIGLVRREKFDLQLEKYITKIVVTNKSGTKTYNLEKSTLGKVEISAKNLKNSTVIAEYTIKVTNKGDIAGNVKNIVDYLPSEFEFSSSLNKDWYKSGKNLYNKSLSDKKLEAGKSAEVKLTLTKKMTDSNTGLINNTAAIYKSANSSNIKDNNAENNKGSADLIISVKTGRVMRLTLITISSIVSIIIVAYYIMRRYKH